MGEQFLAFLSNSEPCLGAEAGSWGCELSAYSEGGMTPTAIKVPKKRLSVNQQDVLFLRQRGGRNRSCHPLNNA